MTEKITRSLQTWTLLILANVLIVGTLYKVERRVADKAVREEIGRLLTRSDKLYFSDMRAHGMTNIGDMIARVRTLELMVARCGMRNLMEAQGEIEKMGLDQVEPFPNND